MSTYEKIDDVSRFYLMLHPRPVVMIIARCPTGRVNAMPASWVTPVSEEPPILAIAVYKLNYTVECLEYSREATINIPRVDQVDLVFKAGTVSGRESDKISRLEIKLSNSSTISTPYWADSLGFMEVKVRERYDAGESWLYLFEVVAAHVKPEAWSRWGWRLPQAGVVLHGSGKAFYKVGSMILARD